MLVYLSERAKVNMNKVSGQSIGVLDIGIGNIASVGRMIEKAGGKPVVINDPDDLLVINKLILPGVGNFDYGMKKLNETGFSPSLIEFSKSTGNYILGICLGMQLLCMSSEEGKSQGLGLVNADVKKLKSSSGSLDFKVPHMGWSVVRPTKENLLLPKSISDYRFYFVHSFVVHPAEQTLTIAESFYGDNFCSAYQYDNIFGVQFHPEKSHRYGKALIHRYLEI